MTERRTSIPTDGFLSDGAEYWRKVHEKRAFEWFEIARDLNRFGHQLRSLIETGTPPAPQHLYLSGLLFLRALSTFQASILLANYGLVTDAGTLVRSTLEDFLLLGMLEKDPAFAVSMMRADALQEKKKLRGLLNLPSDLGLSPGRVEKLQRYVESFPDDLSDIKFDQIARKAGIGHMYDTYYRGLSHTSAHPNIQALTRHTSFDHQGNATGFCYGPDVPKDEIMQIVAYACAIFYCAIHSIITIYDDGTLLVKLDALYQRYSVMARRDFPEIT